MHHRVEVTRGQGHLVALDAGRRTGACTSLPVAAENGVGGRDHSPIADALCGSNCGSSSHVSG
jgi:hypothetical protein